MKRGPYLDGWNCVMVIKILKFLQLSILLALFVVAAVSCRKAIEAQQLVTDYLRTRSQTPTPAQEKLDAGAAAKREENDSASEVKTESPKRIESLSAAAPRRPSDPFAAELEQLNQNVTALVNTVEGLNAPQHASHSFLTELRKRDLELEKVFNDFKNFIARQKSNPPAEPVQLKPIAPKSGPSKSEVEATSDNRK